MAKNAKAIAALVKDALQILQALGVPPSDLTARRQERMAKAFLAVAGIRPKIAWTALQDNTSGRRLLSRQVIAFVNEHLGENIADSSYDDIRRKDLLLPVAALVVMKSAANPDANTNDGTRGYAIEPSAAAVIRTYGTPNWEAELRSYLAGKESLRSQLNRARNLARIPVTLTDGKTLHFSPGAHNDLQKKIIEDFLPIFGFGAEVLYVGDAAKKHLHLDTTRLLALNFFELSHDKLPDVVAYSLAKNRLYLVEAVTTANPIDEMRRLTLAALCEKCTAHVIYITAFPDRMTYRKFAKDIAWETEVWIADAPEHMIHLNGDKFLGPYR